MWQHLLLSLWVRSFAIIAIYDSSLLFLYSSFVFWWEGYGQSWWYVSLSMMIPSSCSFANPPRQNKLTHFRKLQAANHPIVFNGEHSWGGFRWEFWENLWGIFGFPIRTDSFFNKFPIWLNLSKDSVMYLKRVLWMLLAHWHSDRNAVNSSVGRTLNSKALLWTGTPWKIHMEARNHPGKWSSKPQWLCSIMLTWQGCVFFVALSFIMIWHGDVIPVAPMSDVDAIYLGCWLDPDIWNDLELFQNG